MDKRGEREIGEGGRGERGLMDKRGERDGGERAVRGVREG